MPADWAAATSDSTPFTGRTLPSSASSPSRAVDSSRLRSGSWPDAARMPTAMATSYAVPSFGTSAGARLTVIRRDGSSKPELRSAERTRSRASCTWLPASPTMVSDGRPKATSTSTRTGSPSTPSSEALSVWASMGTPLGRRGCGKCRPPACSPPKLQRRPAEARLGTIALPRRLAARYRAAAAGQARAAATSAASCSSTLRAKSATERPRGPSGREDMNGSPEFRALMAPRYSLMIW